MRAVLRFRSSPQSEDNEESRLHPDARPTTQWRQRRSDNCDHGDNHLGDGRSERNLVVRATDIGLGCGRRPAARKQSTTCHFCGFVLTGETGFARLVRLPRTTRARFACARVSLRQSSENR
jgi:hypothetical protein